MMNRAISINRSGAAAYRILINQEADLLRVKLMGQWAYRDSKAFWSMVLREANARKLDRALVMFQLSKPFTVKQSMDLVMDANRVFDESDIRLAVLNPSF
ncbi:MAG: hypothetical protein ACE5E3_06290, partial [Mariprofundus sp.]